MVEAPDAKKPNEATPGTTEKDDVKDATAETRLAGDDTHILEEDDDFEEFNEDCKLRSTRFISSNLTYIGDKDWNAGVPDANEKTEWEDQWDDEEDDDDFAKRLRAEVAATKS